MTFDVQPSRWIKRASGQRVAQIGYGPLGRIRELRLDQLQGVAATGMSEAPRVLDGHDRVSLDPTEALVLRHGSDWWYAPADAVRQAFDRALAERRAVVIDDPDHIRAVELPAETAARGAALARLRTCRGR